VLLTNTPVDTGIKASSSTHVLAGMGLVDHSIEYPHGSLSLPRLLHVARLIREQGPRVCFSLLGQRKRSQAIRDRLFFHFAGIRRIIGAGADVSDHLPPQGARSLWESEAARALRALGGSTGTEPGLRAVDFSLSLTDEERAAGRDALGVAGVIGPFVAMSLGSKLPVKDWGDARWVACLQALAARAPGYALVAIGSKDEAERTAKVLTAWPGNTANLCGRMVPRQSAAVIERADLFLGHDSGPMHLANAVGTPLVAVFSARDMPGIWFPFGQEANVIYRDVPCRGCRLEDCVERKQACVTDIGPGEVVEKALKLLVPAAA
jgi:ADP-heptose:LPS heptosyltransferase